MRKHLGIALMLAVLGVLAGSLAGCEVRFHDEPHRDRDRDRDRREERIYRESFEQRGHGYAEVQGLSRRDRNRSNTYLDRDAVRG